MSFLLPLWPGNPGRLNAVDTFMEFPQPLHPTASLSGHPSREKGWEVIRHHAWMTMGAGVLPIAVLDLWAVATIQVEMIRQLCDVYQVPFEKQKIKAVVAAASVSLLARGGVRYFMKRMPLVGPILGGASMALMTGASTLALGHLFSSHLEAGGEMSGFPPRRWKQQFLETVAEAMKKVTPGSTPAQP